MRKIGILLLLLISILITTEYSCSSGDPEAEIPAEEGFAIYLTKRDIPIDSLKVISHVEIEETPIISMNDIVSYGSENHEILLTTTAFDRIRELDLIGKAFVVCVDRAPIYTGAFMSVFFSRTFDGVVIMCPLKDNERDTIQISLGYPWPEHFTGEDPRADTMIMTYLEQSGIIITVPE